MLEFPSKATRHMVERSGPLGSCFLEVVGSPRQPGSSLDGGWAGAGGGWGWFWPWTPHMSNAEQQEVRLHEAGQAAPIWAVCSYRAWGMRGLGGGSAAIPACISSAVRATDKLRPSVVLRGQAGGPAPLRINLSLLPVSSVCRKHS